MREVWEETGLQIEALIPKRQAGEIWAKSEGDPMAQVAKEKEYVL